MTPAQHHVRYQCNRNYSRWSLEYQHQVLFSHEVWICLSPDCHHQCVWREFGQTVSLFLMFSPLGTIRECSRPVYVMDTRQYFCLSQWQYDWNPVQRYLYNINVEQFHKQFGVNFNLLDDNAQPSQSPCKRIHYRSWDCEIGVAQELSRHEFHRTHLGSAGET